MARSGLPGHTQAGRAHHAAAPRPAIPHATGPEPPWERTQWPDPNALGSVPRSRGDEGASTPTSTLLRQEVARLRAETATLQLAMELRDQFEPHVHHRSHLGLILLAFGFSWFMSYVVAPQTARWPMLLSMTMALMAAFFLLASAYQLRRVTRANHPLAPQAGRALVASRTVGDQMWRHMWSLREAPHLRGFLVLDLAVWFCVAMSALIGLGAMVLVVF